MAEVYGRQPMGSMRPSRTGVPMTHEAKVETPHPIPARTLAALVESVPSDAEFVVSDRRHVEHPMKPSWGERFEDGLVHLGDYPGDGEQIEPFVDARPSTSAGASRAETPSGEHSALRALCHAVGRLLAAVYLALVGRGAWTREQARERATRPRTRA